HLDGAHVVADFVATVTAGVDIVHGSVGELVDVLVAGLARVAAHPLPADAVLGEPGVELLNLIDVLDGLSVLLSPAARLPSGKPARADVADVGAVGSDLDAASAFESAERLDDRL